MADFLEGLGLANTTALVILVYVALALVAFWLALVVWAYRDMRLRSRDRLAQLGVILLAAVFTAPGILIYLLLRPRETLSEAYERSLEEEALLQDIEDKATCPGCGFRVQEHWQVCPQCHTRLKKPCVQCGKTLELPWQICPHCAAAQPNYAADSQPGRFARPASIPEERKTGSTPNTRAAESLEFVEGDEL